jgi:diguanylate cyclase (GGDEF)-like protein/PAS domain S-box-containing protein
MRPDLLSILRDTARLRVLTETGLMDSPSEERFDRYTRLAAKLLHAPTSLISLVDEKRQFFKSAVGLGEPWASARETPLTHSFCKHVVADGAHLAVEDAVQHPVVHDNLAIPDLGVRAYAGMPLQIRGQNVGVLCVIDAQPRPWTEDELDTLGALAAALTSEIELASVRQELLEKVGLLGALTDSAHDAIMTADSNGEIVFCNRATEVLFQRTREELVGAPLTQLMPERYREAHRVGIERIKAGGEARVIGRVVELSGLRKDGQEFPLELSVSRLVGRTGTLLTGVIRDVTERSLTTKALREAEEVLRLTVDYAPIGIALVAPDGRWLRVNDALAGILGYTREELLALDYQHLTHPDDLASDFALVKSLLRGDATSAGLQKRYIHRQGHLVWVDLAVSLVRSSEGQPRFFIAQIQDTTARKAMEEQVRQASLTDELTGLHNRRGFTLMAEQQLKHAERHARRVFVLFIDLNGMKRINDELGHDAGDEALVETARLLRSVHRDSDIVARLGGDEFVVLAEGSPEAADALRARITRQLAALNGEPGRRFALSLSIGVAHYDVLKPVALPQLLADADHAMYQAKRRTKSEADSRLTGTDSRE